jgi:hypothetical protein
MASIDYEQNHDERSANLVWSKRVRILTLLAKGVKRKTIAEKFGISDKSVDRTRLIAIKSDSQVKAELPLEVKSYLNDWIKRKHPDLTEYLIPLTLPKNHIEALHTAGKEVLKYLASYADPYIGWEDETTVEEIIIDQCDLQAKDFFTDEITVGLLTHLQHDIPALRSFKRWADLKVKDIKTVLQIIVVIVDTKDFGGECEGCNDQD